MHHHALVEEVTHLIQHDALAFVVHTPPTGWLPEDSRGGVPAAAGKSKKNKFRFDSTSPIATLSVRPSVRSFVVFASGDLLRSPPPPHGGRRTAVKLRGRRPDQNGPAEQLPVARAPWSTNPRSKRASRCAGPTSTPPPHSINRHSGSYGEADDDAGTRRAQRRVPSSEIRQAFTPHPHAPRCDRRAVTTTATITTASRRRRHVAATPPPTPPLATPCRRRRRHRRGHRRRRRHAAACHRHRCHHHQRSCSRLSISEHHAHRQETSGDGEHHVPAEAATWRRRRLAVVEAAVAAAAAAAWRCKRWRRRRRGGDMAARAAVGGGGGNVGG